MAAAHTTITIENITITAPDTSITIDGQQPEAPQACDWMPAPPERISRIQWRHCQALDGKIRDMLNTTDLNMPYRVAEAVKDIFDCVYRETGALSWCGALPTEIDSAINDLLVALEDEARQAQDFADECDEMHRLESIGPVYDDEDDYGKDFMTDAEGNLVACQGTEEQSTLVRIMDTVESHLDDFVSVCNDHQPA